MTCCFKMVSAPKITVSSRTDFRLGFSCDLVFGSKDMYLLENTSFVVYMSQKLNNLQTATSEDGEEDTCRPGEHPC